ncbi:MAG TPA: nucleotide sugar dehydrogenase [Thermofilum sp.]|nr:nucleotide sugar dehydrogenase [Thermofilum sp.]
MGLPLALVFTRVGAKVIGVDIDERKVELLNKGVNVLPEEPRISELLTQALRNGKFEATTDGMNALEQSDLAVILIPTLVDENKVPKLEGVFFWAQVFAKTLKDKEDGIFIVESTVPPGTCKKIIKLIEKESGLRVGEDFGVAHAPERTMSGRVIKDITESYPKIVGASDPETLEVVKGIYETINKRGVITVSSLTAAEAVKVFEGIYRDVNIALANELAIYAEKLGIDVWEVIEAANSQPYCHIHRPGAGVGGHCIPVYPYFILNSEHKFGVRFDLIRKARERNESMPNHVVDLVIRGLNKVKKSVNGSSILIVGLAYRPRVREHRFSPSIEIIKSLKELGGEIYVYDPAYNCEDLERLGYCCWRGEDVDAVVIVTEYNEILDLLIKKAPGLAHTQVVIDARGITTVEELRKAGYEVIKLGSII